MSQQQTAPHTDLQPTDPALASRSTHNWNAFTKYVGYAAAAITVVLCLMALFLT